MSTASHQEEQYQALTANIDALAERVPRAFPVGTAKAS